MGFVPEVLWEFARPGSLSRYESYHNPFATDPESILEKFLFSTMDEVRLRYADKYSEILLDLVEMQSLSFFRKEVLRRETLGEISYQKQRDHSAHTLYNYLLGWLIYCNSRRIEQYFNSSFERRGINKNLSNFGNLWIQTSLLHDIGYMFEGELSPLSTSIQSEKTLIGAKIVEEYFIHRFWSEIEINTVFERQFILDQCGIDYLTFPINSMARIGTTLRTLGNLENLRASALRLRNTQGLPPGNVDFLNRPAGLSCDAFESWKRHYEAYGPSSMVNRLKNLMKIFEWSCQEGLGNSGSRILNHAICSGLLLLLYNTLYMKIKNDINNIIARNAYEDEIIYKIRNRISLSPHKDDAIWWWIGTVWATAATALHDVLLYKTSWPIRNCCLDKLDIEEDPLTYLGILVDCIQEWDRNTISHESIIGGFLPIQGANVELNIRGDKIEINYNNLYCSAEVQQTLNECLNNWTNFVVILP